MHALVGYGWHGKNEDIQDLRCQACRKKFTVRRPTVLYRLKTPSQIIRLALNQLAVEGDVSALEEALAIRESPLRPWLTRSGEQERKLHEGFFRMLEIVPLQLDEVWAQVKQAGREVRVWTVCDAKTKPMPVL